MYFPYLRARQFELIALRELVSDGAIPNIVPILLHVKDSTSNLVCDVRVQSEDLYTPSPHQTTHLKQRQIHTNKNHRDKNPYDENERRFDEFAKGL